MGKKEIYYYLYQKDIIAVCYFPDSIMNQPSIIKEENIDSDSVSVFFERIL